MATREPLEQHIGRLSSGHVLLELLFLSLAFIFVDEGGRLVGDEVSGHRAMFTSVIASVSESLEFESRSILEKLRAPERGGQVCTANLRRQGRLLPSLWSLDSIDRQVNHKFSLCTSVVFSMDTSISSVNDSFSHCLPLR